MGGRGRRGDGGSHRVDDTKTNDDYDIDASGYTAMAFKTLKRDTMVMSFVTHERAGRFHCLDIIAKREWDYAAGDTP
jgi:hypothetical protein